MRGIPDRFWWLQRAVGIMLAAGSFIATIYFVIQAYNTYNLAQIPSGDPEITAILRNQAQSFLLLGVMFALFVVRGILFIWDSFRARDRQRRRTLAIERDQEVLLRATIKIDTGNAPDLSSGPLELLWRATALRRRVVTTLYIFIALIFGPIALLFIYLAYCLVTNTPVVGSTDPTPISPLERGAIVLVFAVVAAGLLLVLALLVWTLPSHRGKPYGVLANADGLWYYPNAGKKRFLRWEEMRLLEVASPERQRLRKYKLYSRDAVAEWWEQPPSSFATMDLTKQEFEERHQALLNLIVARTHLLPRTLDKRLAVADASASV